MNNLPRLAIWLRDFWRKHLLLFTVAGPLRNYTGFPIYFLPVPRASPERFRLSRNAASGPETKARGKTFRRKARSSSESVKPHADLVQIYDQGQAKLEISVPPRTHLPCPLRKLEALHRLHHRLRGDAQLLHHNATRGAETKAIDSDDASVLAHILPPQSSHPGLDGNTLPAR